MAAPTSNARAVKQAIIDDLTTMVGSVALLADVQVAYSQQRDMARQWIAGGRVTVGQVISAGRRTGDTTRTENATIAFHLRVSMPGATTAEAEIRVLEIGSVLEDYLAGTGPVVDGLLDASVDSFELDSDYDDDAAIAVMDYQIRTESHIAEA